MEKKHFLTAVVLLVIIIASLVSYYDLKSTSLNEQSGDFCMDYSSNFPGCWCKAMDEKITDFNVTIANEFTASNIVGNYYDSISQPCSNIECFDLGKGFYNCFCNSEYYGTLRNNGEYYMTECGV